MSENFKVNINYDEDKLAKHSVYNNSKTTLSKNVSGAGNIKSTKSINNNKTDNANKVDTILKTTKTSKTVKTTKSTKTSATQVNRKNSINNKAISHVNSTKSVNTANNTNQAKSIKTQSKQKTVNKDKIVGTNKTNSGSIIINNKAKKSSKVTKKAINKNIKIKQQQEFYKNYLQQQKKDKGLIKFLKVAYPAVFCGFMISLGKDLITFLISINNDGKLNSKLTAQADIRFWEIIGLFFFIMFFVNCIFKFIHKTGGIVKSKFVLNKYIFRKKYITFLISGIIGFLMRIVIDTIHALTTSSAFYVIENSLKSYFNTIIIFVITLSLSLGLSILIYKLTKNLTVFILKSTPKVKNHFIKMWNEL